VTKHIIVDGSNIATEGRSTPSLAQLHEAVTAFIKEYPNAKITVVVDATFGHRIAKKEVAEFNKAIEHNELVAPPAGAIGRGDAFILAIAEKAKATILSNDSFQEFHGKYKWLFDEGRLIGGKPVPHVGWVFVGRVPARGETSRKAVRTGKVVAKDHTPSPEARKPMPVPKAPPPGAREKMINAVMPYLGFVEKHPVGSTVHAIVDGYAANGMTVKIGDISGYVPIRNMSSPPPRSAREKFKMGDEMDLVIVSYTPSRRSVDLAVPGVVEVKKPEPAKKSAAKKTAPARKAAAAKEAPAKKAAPAAKEAAVKKAPAKKAAPAKKTVAKKAAPAAKEAAVKKAPAKKAAPAKMPATKKS
jgi:hypothetical protein